MLFYRQNGKKGTAMNDYTMFEPYFPVVAPVLSKLYFLLKDLELLLLKRIMKKYNEYDG